MLSAGIQRTLARVSSASAIQVLACAAATIRGRASESRRAVARLIGNRRSVGSNGAALSVMLVARGDRDVTALGRFRNGRAGWSGHEGQGGGRCLAALARREALMPVTGIGGGRFPP